VDGREDVALLGVARDHRRGAEGQQLVALGGRGAVHHHDEVRLRLRLVPLVDLDRAAQRGEVDDHDVGLGLGHRRLDGVRGDVRREDVHEVVLGQQGTQPIGDQVRELAEKDGDHVTNGYRPVRR
jgi:hypothetical protein